MYNKLKAYFVYFKKYGKDKEILTTFRLTLVLCCISLFHVFCSLLLVCATLPSNESLFHNKSPCSVPCESYLLSQYHFFSCLLQTSSDILSFLSFKKRKFFPSSLFISLLPNP